jgi:hypothetical protein
MLANDVDLPVISSVLGHGTSMMSPSVNTDS